MTGGITYDEAADHVLPATAAGRDRLELELFRRAAALVGQPSIDPETGVGFRPELSHGAKSMMVWEWVGADADLSLTSTLGNRLIDSGARTVAGLFRCGVPFRLSRPEWFRLPHPTDAGRVGVGLRAIVEPPE
jgi:hypothetical protein